MRHSIRQKYYQFVRACYRCRRFIPGMREKHRREAMVGPLGCWNELQEYQLKVLKENGLMPHHSLLDIGCGPLQGGIALIAYLDSSKYVGVDRRSTNLSAGYRQIGDFDLAWKNPRLIVCDRFGTSELGGRQFDFIWASQILYYFDARLMNELFALIAKHLKPTGKFLGDIVGDCEPEFLSSRHREWLDKIQPHSVDSLNEAARVFGLNARNLGTIMQYGYPKQLNLRRNILVEVSR